MMRLVDKSSVIESIKANDAYIIDVREVDEFKAGNIPTSINLPLSSLVERFSLSDEQFKEVVGWEKPLVDDKVIVYCRSGRRSSDAWEILNLLGYSDVSNYKGSWLDWVNVNNENVVQECKK